MNNPDCVFCKIIRKEIPAEIIHETDDVIAIVDLKPDNVGHSLVIPKSHYENTYSIPDELLGKVAIEIKKISIAVKKATNADGINIHVNNEKAAGQLIPHAHTHIIPRFFNDGLIHFAIKGYDYDGQIKEIAEKIRENL